MKKYLWLIIITSTGLKMLVIDDYALAGDEKYTLLVSQFLIQEGTNQPESLRNNKDSFSSKDFWQEMDFRDFQETMARRENGSGASYFYMMHWWSKAFGISNLAMRLPSLLFTAGLVYLIFLLSLQLFPNTPKMALLAAFLAACSPFLFNYGLIARNYAFTYFWFTLATLFFIKILRTPKSPIIWYIIYALSLTLTIFGHHSAYIIYILHVLVYFIERNWKKTVPLFLAGLPSIGLFLLWLQSEGGKYAFEFIENSKLQYLEWVKEGTLEASNLSSVFIHFSQTFSNLLLSLSGQIVDFERPKQLALLLILGLVMFAIERLGISKTIRLFLNLGIALIPLFVLGDFKLSHITIPFGTWITIEAFFALGKSEISLNNKLIIFLMAFFPLVILIQYALSDGVIVRLNARYAGFAFPFLILFFAFLLTELEVRKKHLLVLFSTFLTFLIVLESTKIAEDLSPRYFHYTPSKRIKNPYNQIAQSILQAYEPGDTVIHNSYILPALAGKVETFPFSVQEAQYIGLYLPKDKPEVIQKFDINEPDKVFLKKKNGDRILIFDFEGDKFRYD